MNLVKKNIRGLFLFRWFKGAEKKNFSDVPVDFLKKTAAIIAGVLLLIFFIVYFEVYIPLNPNSREVVTFIIQRGWGDREIARNLKEAGLIRSSYFFQLYTVMSLRHLNLQAGKYNLSAKMPLHEIAKKIALGNVVKDKIVILEGWTERDIAKYLESRGFCPQEEFISFVKNDYPKEFDFLKDKPADMDLEGYLFPDSYEVSGGESCEDILIIMLSNFGKKLVPEIRSEIENQNKTIFDIVIMASLLEKEIRIFEEKKIVSGILWKRLSAGMPLQLDATVNYITGKNDPGVLLKDAQIDSPYNTYKYNGLPIGPISNPGIESIKAALFPTETKYWFYLSDGKTIFSETFEQHNAVKVKYLRRS